MPLEDLDKTLLTRRDEASLDLEDDEFFDEWPTETVSAKAVSGSRTDLEKDEADLKDTDLEGDENTDLNSATLRTLLGMERNPEGSESSDDEVEGSPFTRGHASTTTAASAKGGKAARVVNWNF